MRKVFVRFPWIIAVTGVGIVLFLLSFLFSADENENIFPRSRQNDGGRAFLDFLRLKQYRITESYNPLSDSLPQIRHRNRSAANPQLLIIPQRAGASPLRISEIAPLLEFLSGGNSAVFITRNPDQILSRLELQFSQENHAERSYLARKNPAVQMSQTIRQLLQEFDTENNFTAAEKEATSQRTMESFPAVCRDAKNTKRLYILAAEPNYLVSEPAGTRLLQTAYCTSEDHLIALSYRAFGGTLQFLSPGSLLQNRYIPESGNIDFLIDFLQPQLYSEILWSEFHNNIFTETNLSGRLLADWRGRFIFFLIILILKTAVLYSLRVQKSQYRRQRERLSLRGLIYPAELVSRYRRKKLLKKISAPPDAAASE